MLETVETGDTGRNMLWEAAFNVIGDNIIIGAGFEGLIPRMYQYSGIHLAPHNIFLYLFITTGLPGLILEVSAGNTTMLCSKIIMNPAEKAKIKVPEKGEEVSKNEYQEIISGKMIRPRLKRRSLRQ